MRARGILIFLALAWAATVWAGPEVGAYRDADPELLDRLRRGFEIAPESAAETAALEKSLVERLSGPRSEWPPVFQAYAAALEGLSGKHSRLPWNKLKRTKAGLAQLDALVAAHPESIEIRMLRYFFGSQLPDFFETGSQAEADLVVLADLLERGADAEVSGAYRRHLIRWILQHGKMAPEPRRKLEAALEKSGGETE